MADMVKQILAKPIQLADRVTKVADNVSSFGRECADIKTKTDRLAALLRQAARAGSDLYERPTRRIISQTEQVLDDALELVLKCCANGFRRVFTFSPMSALRKASHQLDDSIVDVSWLLRVSAQADDQYLGLPPIAADQPILCLIWEQIALLCSSSAEERADAAASLVSLACDNERYGKLIMEEGGVAPLLKLAKEGGMEGQENAVKAIGLLGRDPEKAEQIVNAGVCQVFAKILKDGLMKVQVVVAWAVSELATHHPKSQDYFAQNNIVRLLVGHLAFETIQEHSKYVIPSKQTAPVPTTSTANTNLNHDQLTTQISHSTTDINQIEIHHWITNTMSKRKATPPESPLMSGPANRNNRSTKSNRQQHVSSDKQKEPQDPATKAQMKAMAAKALCHLCTGNVSVCQSITETRALLCFAALLEKGPHEVQYNSAMALMEITAVAEQNADLRHGAFKPTSPAAKAVVDQLVRAIDKADSDLLIPCVKAIGHLARTFRASETRIIVPLVRLLDKREAAINREAAIALGKFACSDNYLHVNHSKAIIDAGGTRHILRLVSIAEQSVQGSALSLISYVAMHMPDSETLAKEGVLNVLEWALKQEHLMQDRSTETLLLQAKRRLELYQSRSSTGFN